MSYRNQFVTMRDFVNKSSQRLPPPRVSAIVPAVQVPEKVEEVSEYTLPSTTGSLVSLTDSRDTPGNDNDESCCTSSKCQWLIVIIKCLLRVLIVAVYLVIGAYIFQYLELTNETSVCYQTQALYLKSLNTTLTHFLMLYDLGLHTDTLTEVALVLLNDFGENAYLYNFDPYRNCSTIGQQGVVYTWSIPNSLMYSLTIVSTIGYGYLYPLTDWGKLVTISYAMLGIPIMVICLAGIGDILSQGFRHLYANFCCCLICIRCKMRNKVAPAPEQVEHSNRLGPPLNKKKGGATDTLDPFKKNWNTSSAETAPSESNPSKAIVKPRAGDNQPTLRLRVGSNSTQKSSDGPEELVRIDDPEVNYDKIIDSFDVPFFFLLCIVAAFIFAGVGVYLNQGWTMLDSVYFSFISLATIGFGDFVPDRGQPDTPQLLADMVASIAYILVGMAILSMCLNLIQDDMMEKAQWLLGKLSCKKKKCCKCCKKKKSTKKTLSENE